MSSGPRATSDQPVAVVPLVDEGQEIAIQAVEGRWHHAVNLNAVTVAQSKRWTCNDDRNMVIITARAAQASQRTRPITAAPTATAA